jgi:MoaA/NifB/PqqE/SkfB family radical SAM enzyme
VSTLLTAATTTSLPIAAPYPRQLVLDWTDYCNAKCFFCYREKYEKDIGGMGEFIPFEKLKKLESVFSKVQIFCISSGIGEPLLHPQLEEFLTWLYTINPSIKLQVVTNGTTLTAGKAPWFAGHLDWLSVSLNAANGEAHMRDMFPHLAKRGIDAEKRWNLHVRHLTEFVAELPVEDRSRIRFQMVTHRHNVTDVVDFVRLVHQMGASQAVITNISVHPDTMDWSLYWIKDQYNSIVEEAREVGTRLGVQVQAVKFFTGVKPNIDLDQMCRDPNDIAYISRSRSADPCCHWTEKQIPVDYYNDEQGFEKYWNSELLQKLRRKRDFVSCRACGLSRIFDEASFHFSFLVKRQLIAEGRLSDMENDYPDAALVRACSENQLDLPSIRHTLLQLNLPPEKASSIEVDGLSALVNIERACWDAFQEVHVPIALGHIALSGPFLGIGWGPSIHEPQNRVSARWISAAQAASIFIRVEEEAECELRFTIHHVHPTEKMFRLVIEVCECPLPTRTYRDHLGRTVLSASVPHALRRAFGGRLWIKVGEFGKRKAEAGNVSLIEFSACESNNYDLSPIETRDPQERQLADLAAQLEAVYASRSWRLTAPLRKTNTWLQRRH